VHCLAARGRRVLARFHVHGCGELCDRTVTHARTAGVCRLLSS
jgi:hypothetical protein